MYVKGEIMSEVSHSWLILILFWRHQFSYDLLDFIDIEHTNIYVVHEFYFTSLKVTGVHMMIQPYNHTLHF